MVQDIFLQAEEYTNIFSQMINIEIKWRTSQSNSYLYALGALLFAT